MIAWTEVHRREHTVVTLAVTDAPEYDGFETIRVKPTEVTYGYIDGELTTVGITGDIVAGPGSKSGGRIATNWPLADSPEWLRQLADEALA